MACRSCSALHRDTPAALKEKISHGLKRRHPGAFRRSLDGDYDFTKAVFRDLGAEMNFLKLAIRPGQPLAFGKIQGKLAFGLPGNPVSSMVTFEQLVRPAMLKLSGTNGYGRPMLQAVFQENFRNEPTAGIFSVGSCGVRAACSKFGPPVIKDPGF